MNSHIFYVCSALTLLTLMAFFLSHSDQPFHSSLLHCVQSHIVGNANVHHVVSGLLLSCLLWDPRRVVRTIVRLIKCSPLLWTCPETNGDGHDKLWRNYHEGCHQDICLDDAMELPVLMLSEMSSKPVGE